MSAIQKAILKVCDIDAPAKDESRQDFIRRAIKAINGLEDEDYNKLSKDVVKWFNDAGDVADANKKAKEPKALPDFPDFEAEEETPRRRRASEDDADEKPAAGKKGAKKEDESTIKVGTNVTVVKKNGREVVGELIERTKEFVVVKTEDGKEREVDLDDIESIVSVNDGKGADEPETPADPAVGDQVEILTTRGKKIEGEVLEISDDELVLATDDEPKGEDFARKRIESIKVLKPAKKAKKEEDDKPATGKKGAKKDEEEEGGRTRSSNGGVSVGQRIRELMCDDLEATAADIMKKLKKEGLEFRENTVSLAFNEASKLLKLLKERKMLKA